MFIGYFCVYFICICFLALGDDDFLGKMIEVHHIFAKVGHLVDGGDMSGYSCNGGNRNYFFEMKVRMIYCCRLLVKEALATELVDGLGLGR